MRPNNNDFIPVTAAFCRIMTENEIITTWDYGRCVGRQMLRPITVTQLKAALADVFAQKESA